MGDYQNHKNALKLSFVDFSAHLSAVGEILAITTSDVEDRKVLVRFRGSERDIVGTFSQRTGRFLQNPPIQVVEHDE